jgi:hypothetical protein
VMMTKPSSVLTSPLAKTTTKSLALFSTQELARWFTSQGPEFAQYSQAV